MDFSLIAYNGWYTQKPNQTKPNWQGPIYGSNRTRMCTYAKRICLKYNCFFIQLCVNKRRIFDWIVIDTKQYLEPLNFVD